MRWGRSTVLFPGAVSCAGSRLLTVVLHDEVHVNQVFWKLSAAVKVAAVKVAAVKVAAADESTFREPCLPVHFSDCRALVPIDFYLVPLTCPVCQI